MVLCTWVVKDLCNVLWYIDPFHQRLKARHIKIPEPFDTFTGYRNWKQQHKKRTKGKIWLTASIYLVVQYIYFKVSSFYICLIYKYFVNSNFFFFFKFALQYKCMNEKMNLFDYKQFFFWYVINRICVAS